MEVDPPSALTRFGMFFLAGGVALILALWGVLRWLDHPHALTAAPGRMPPTHAGVRAAP